MWEWFINLLTAILAGIEGFVGDWGLAVIVLTLIIRLILTPLMTHSTKSTARMQVMQPKLQEIQERYADDPTRQAEELRKVYADMKFNPLGGCLPLILQMPVFFGLFSVVRNVPTDASFFNILPSISLSVAQVVDASGIVAAVPYIAFDVLFGILTFVPMVLTARNQPAEQRSQSYMMGGVMAILMLWFGWASCPAAVLLYYVTSSLWQVVQQQLITKRVMEKAKAEAAAEAANKPIEVDVVRREKKPRPHKKS
ncbi:YidC/Oxa1 family membrane protein insertase [Olsenella profusa]|uniref:Membrane protein insertase YidC n=1 Tax=Olsenella profusa TaxID=138595 RepID=A0ABS2F0H1_9ACTN|nr:YidC/Oxa1 family membrane protein insertase [Olsenella profusa]MBM6774455.1 YidC/Oxa1 family membrane protein insertase [Olsenella profusa]